MKRKQLGSLIDGEKGKIVRIRGEAALYRNLLKMGLFVGRTIYVEAINPAPTASHIDIRINGGFLSLEKDVAANIHVDVA